MIHVDIFKRDSNIFALKVSGHANYDEKGKDIVCASVSANVYSFALFLESMNADFDFYDKKEYILFKFSQKNDKIKNVLEYIVSFFKTMEEQYPYNVKVKLQAFTSIKGMES